ncbi:ribosome maturation factor RimP [Algihabitans albus]|uniref:ribosome maturation factor RimP n=1 Tax=Algihabitans albus TaxID=2164067 RepID=UPI000E5D26E3|nr:ribosome maturation factor RimP [Algihabitans albus]
MKRSARRRDNRETKGARVAERSTGGETGGIDAAQSAIVSDLITPALEDLGFHVVRVQLSGGRGFKLTLQVLAERPDGSMTVADCAQASRTVSALLDVEDPIGKAYLLEVASPGIDRPLTRLKDFSRWAGFEARVELVALHEGQRRFSGPLIGVEGQDVVIDTQEGRKHLPFAGIAKAKLIMTEALLKRTAPSRSET